MTCACAIAAYLGLALPLLDGIPRTTEFERFDSSSSSPVETVSLSGVIATSSDGSRMNRISGTIRKFLFVTEQINAHSIYRRIPHGSYLIDDDKRTVRVIPCTCEWERSPWPADAKCSSAAKKYDPDLVYAGTTRVAGVPVIRYREFSSSDFVDVAFAPSLGCDVMEEVKIVFGIGRERSYLRFRVTKYIPGEPNPEVFTLPSDFRGET